MQDKYIINKIAKKSQFIEITWCDKHISKFHFLWLRDNCPSAIHPTANMRIFNILYRIEPLKENNILEIIFIILYQKTSSMRIMLCM